MKWLLLHNGVHSGSYLKIQFGLLIGKDINGKDAPGRTPLHIASMYENSRLTLTTRSHNLKIVRLLLKNKAEIDVKDRLGFTPLHWASMCRNLEIVRLLLKNRAEVNVKDRDGRTPLHCASGGGLARGRGHLEIIKLLLKNGANPHITNDNGRTPLHCARDYIKNKPLQTYLYSYDKLYNALCLLNEWRPWNHTKYPRYYRNAMMTLVILAKS